MLGSSPVATVIMLALLGLLPFLLMTTTSFLKLSIVFSILRNALGTNSIPSGTVVTALAATLSIYVMAPVFPRLEAVMRPSMAQIESEDAEVQVDGIFSLVRGSGGVLRDFMERHVHPQDLALFFDLAQRQARSAASSPARRSQQPTEDGADTQPTVAQSAENGADTQPTVAQSAEDGVNETEDGANQQPTVAQSAENGVGQQPTVAQSAEDGADTQPTVAQSAEDGADTQPTVAQSAEDGADTQPTQHDFWVVMPAFMLSELREAFQIGFLLFLPFLVVDFLVANLLLALGMQMLSPTSVSLPLKLLLFVGVDGWYLLARALILGYQ